MKTRQSKLFENLSSKSDNKATLKRNPSYECITENIIPNGKTIPNLIIRRKKHGNSQNLKTDSKNNRKSLSIENHLIINRKVEPKIEIIESKIPETPSNDLNVPKPILLPQLPPEVIENRIAKCATLSNLINCEDIFTNFLSKVNISDKICWNELYNPKSSQFTLSSNAKNVMKFKHWLENWKIGKDNSQTTKTAAHSDDSDFEFVPNSKEMKMSLPPVCIVKGACGVGKSSLVYTVASELKYLVFEVNCSDRRTGKDVLDKFESAVHCQHISVASSDRKNVPIQFPNPKTLKRKSVKSFFEPITKKPKIEASLKRSDSNLTLENCSLFLFDDVDVLMDDDKGFMTAVCNLAEKQIRPIILTATDSVELKKTINKLGKIPFLLVKLEQNSFSNLAVYLQLILLSRGVEMDHCHLLQWIHGLSSDSIPDLRSCLHNMQFDFVTEQLRIVNKLEFDHWSRYRASRLQFPIERKEDESVKSTDENSNLSVNNEDKHRDSINERQNKLLCLKGLRYINVKSNILSKLDSQKTLYYNGKHKTLERNSTIDNLSKTYYDRNTELSSEITETLMSLYNSFLHKSMTKFETEILSTSYIPESSKVPKSTSPNPIVNTIQNNLTASTHIRSAVAGSRDRLDRIETLKKIASFEINRQKNSTQRRFRHYFDRLHLNIRESEMKYLIAQYKNI